MKINEMITTVALLDLTNEYQGWNDYQISKFLGVGTGVVSGWRTGRRVMSDKYVDKFADLLGFQREWLLLHILAERSLKQPYYDKLKRFAEDETPPEVVKMLNRLETLDHAANGH